MIKFFLTALGMLIFSPAALLWFVAEVVYIIAFFFKLLCSVLYTLALAASANFDDYLYTYTFYGDITGTAKRLIVSEIADQWKALRLSSDLLGRKD